MTTNFDEEKRARLWQEYSETHTPAVRSLIVQEYEYLVRRAVFPFLAKKPPMLDFDDLMQAGKIGLLDAIEKYDPNRAILFQTYAMWRIQGQIKDEINGQDWTPRSIREHIRGVIKAIQAHMEEKQSEPTVAEIAERTGMDIEETRLVLSQMNKTYMVQADHEMLTLYAPSTDETKTDLQSDVRYVMQKMLTKQEYEYALLKLINGYQNNEIQLKMGLTPQQLKQLRETTISKLQQGLRGYESLVG